MAAGKPWWQTTKTPLQGFGLGGLWASVGLLQLFTGGHVWNLVIGAFGLVLATVYLASAAALLRRKRSGTVSVTRAQHVPPSSS